MLQQRQFLSELDGIFALKEEKRRTLDGFSGGKDVYTLLPTDFGKSLVASHTNKNPRTAATWLQRVQETQIGQLERDRKFVPSLFKLCFPNASYRLFAGWMHVIDTKDLESAPSKVSEL